MYLVVHGEGVLDAVHREEDVPGEGQGLGLGIGLGLRIRVKDWG